MIEAYKKYWKNYADFTGRSSRSDFWWAYLMNVLISLGINLVMAIFSAMSVSADGTVNTGSAVLVLIVGIIVWIWAIANIIPMLAISIRRLRDAGYHWAWFFINAVPFGVIAYIVFLCKPSVAPVYYNQFQTYPNQPVQPQQPMQPQQPVQPVMPQAQPAAVNTQQGVSQAVSETASQAPVTSETPQA